MPFTPLHLGPGLAIKGLIPRYFSLSIFAVANAAMDIEPLYRMWRVEFPLHGVSHTLLGALVIAAAAATFGRPLVETVWKLLARLSGENERFPITPLQAWAGALLGTGSHLMLDAIMHGDMHPFAPLTEANPLLAYDWVLPMHLGCVLAGMAGVALILTRIALQQESL